MLQIQNGQIIFIKWAGALIFEIHNRKDRQDTVEIVNVHRHVMIFETKNMDNDDQARIGITSTLDSLEHRLGCACTCQVRNRHVYFLATASLCESINSHVRHSMIVD